MLTREKFILLDINTIQRYLKIKGEHHVRRCNKMINRIKEIFTWTKNNKVPVISIIPEDTHEERYKKFEGSLMKDIGIFQADNSTDLPIPRFEHNQLIFHNRVEDPFEEPKIDRMLSELGNRTIVLMGISKSIIPMVLGLLKREKRVLILEDATRFPSLSTEEINMAKKKLRTKGAKITTTKIFLENERSLEKWQNEIQQEKESLQTRTVMSV